MPDEEAAQKDKLLAAYRKVHEEIGTIQGQGIKNLNPVQSHRLIELDGEAERIRRKLQEDYL